MTHAISEVVLQQLYHSPTNAAASVGSNFRPSNPDLAQAVQERIAALQAADPQNTLPVPVDLVTASASGLDPHISVAAALFRHLG